MTDPYIKKGSNSKYTQIAKQAAEEIVKKSAANPGKILIQPTPIRSINPKK